MGILAELFFTLIRKKSRIHKDKRSNYIFYKIVDSPNTNNDEEYTLQCINTKAIFQINIADIIFDASILHSLHPIQSCYIGIEYARYLKKQEGSFDIQKSSAYKLRKQGVSRYGRYSICYQNREGKICFIDKVTQETKLMDPRNIALSEELIQEFDAIQTFYIGLLVGIKLNNPIKQPEIKQKLHLRIVK